MPTISAGSSRTNVASAWQAAWNLTAGYNPGDMVTYARAVYIAKAANSGLPPGTNPAAWILLTPGSCCSTRPPSPVPSWLWWQSDRNNLNPSGVVAVPSQSISIAIDYSLLSHNGTAPTGATPPGYQTDPVVGVPGWYFGYAVTDELSNAVNPASAQTSFVVARFLAGGTTQMWGDTSEFIGIYGSTYQAFQPGLTLNSGVAQDLALHLHTVYTGEPTNPDGFYQVDLNPAAAGNNFNAYTSFHISNHATQPFKGFVFEVMTYNSQLSTSDIASVQTYLRNKWGTP